MEYLCSVRIDIPGWSSIRIKNLIVRAVESSSNIRQYHFEFARHGRFLQPKLYRRTKNDVIEVFINRLINKYYKEFAREYKIEKKGKPRTSKYKEKTGSFIQDLIVKLPDIIAEALAVEFLTYLASKLKQEFEKLLKQMPPKKGKNDKSKGNDQPPKEHNESPIVQVSIGKLIAENVTIIITK